MKKGVYVTLLFISFAVVLGTMFFWIFNKNNNELKNNNINIGKVTFRVIQREFSNNKEKIISERVIKDGDLLTDLEDLPSSSADINILEINPSSVKISRNRIKYEIDYENEKVNSSYEEVIEDIEYDSSFALNIGEKEPCYPGVICMQAVTAPKYNYYGVFVKN